MQTSTNYTCSWFPTKFNERPAHGTFNVIGFTRSIRAWCPLLWPNSDTTVLDSYLTSAEFSRKQSNAVSAYYSEWCPTIGINLVYFIPDWILKFLLATNKVVVNHCGFFLSVFSHLFISQPWMKRSICKKKKVLLNESSFNWLIARITGDQRPKLFR